MRVRLQEPAPEPWLQAGLGYIAKWLDFQVRHLEQPGCAVAVAHGERILADLALGVANLSSGDRLTPSHRFRVASHSKTFTAAGVLRLHEARRLRLDDAVGVFVRDLDPTVGELSIAQLLSHSAGLSRDGLDSGYFMDRRSCPSADELRRDLQMPLLFEPGARFKYSNHGYGLLGLVIEAVSGEPYATWMRREVIEAAGLAATEPDITFCQEVPVAHGHSGKLPVGRRLVIRGDNAAGAISAATGFVSTARDLALFYAQLAPIASRSLLSTASRRVMTHRHWRDEAVSVERYYGFGTTVGPPGPWSWFGHSGTFPGFATRTVAVPEQGLALSVLTNAIDGPVHAWCEGAIHILEAFCRKGAPESDVAQWSGRWWTLWGPIDLVPFGTRVALVNPVSQSPLSDAAELEIVGPLLGRIASGSGFSSLSEPVRRVLDAEGRPRELWIGAAKLVPEADLAEEMLARYAGPETARGPSN